MDVLLSLFVLSGVMMAGTLIGGGLLSLWRLRDLRLRRRFALGNQAIGAGRLDEAEALFRGSLAIAERRFRPEDSRVAAHAAGLALTLIEQKRLDEATPLLERTVAAVRTRAEVATDATVAYVEHVGATLALARGDAGGALDHLERARKRATATQIAGIEIERAQLLETKGERDRAKALLLAVDPKRAPLRPAIRAVMLGRLFMTAGNHVGAVVLFGRLVESERRRGEQSIALAEYRGLVGEAHQRAGRHLDARYSLTLALETYDSIAPNDHAIPALLMRLARVHLALGDRATAENACLRALTALPEVERPASAYRDPPTAAPLAELREEAERLLEELRRQVRTG